MTIKSWKVAVKGKEDTGWVFNELRFGTREEADKYGAELCRRWMAIRFYEVHPSNDAPNTKYPVPNSTYLIKREGDYRWH